MESEEETTSSICTILSSEIKELRNKIISIKKSVTKGDKKQKKVIQDELNLLESLLNSKQEELKKVKSEEIDNSEENEDENRINKSKLKKERRKEKKEAEWEANRMAALEEISSRPDLAQEESKAFSHRLSEGGFRILEIAADGHCMFSAIGCQLDPPRDHWELRKLAAKYLRRHREEFENFIELNEGEDEEVKDKFEIYCKRIESTGLWGGQIELEVLSRALNIIITVLQADGPELIFNAEQQQQEHSIQRIYLSFHRYAFSLGEHYNALLRQK